MSAVSTIIPITVYSIIEKQLIESHGVELDGALVSGVVGDRQLLFRSKDEAIKDAIRHESGMEASCDVLIARAQNELREALRIGDDSSAQEFNISAISARRDGHRANHKALLGLIEKSQH